MSGLSPLYKTLGDVNVTGLANGDLATYDSATGKWIPITRTALATALNVPSITGTTNTGSATINAGASNTFTITHTLAATAGLIMASAWLAVTFDNFNNWEILWIAGGGRQLGGRFLGPGVTTYIGTPPSVPASASQINIKLYNRDVAQQVIGLSYALISG